VNIKVKLIFKSELVLVGEELKWSSAFKAAFKIVAASLIFVLIGGFLMAMGVIIVSGPYNMHSMGYSLEHVRPAVTILTGIVLFIIGFLIAELGILASFLKYSGELYAKEIRGQM